MGRFNSKSNRWYGSFDKFTIYRVKSSIGKHYLKIKNYIFYSFKIRITDNDYSGYLQKFVSGSNTPACTNTGYHEIGTGTNFWNYFFFGTDNSTSNQRCHWSIHAPNAKKMKIYIWQYKVSKKPRKILK